MIQQANANQANAARESLICRNHRASLPVGAMSSSFPVRRFPPNQLPNQTSVRPFITVTNVITVPAGQRESCVCVC